MIKFRSTELAEQNKERALRYLIPRNASNEEKQQAKKKIESIINECGPVVEWYPCWHPLTCNHEIREVVFNPSEKCGYHGLDHTIFLAHGFISCPYGNNADKILKSVVNLPYHDLASIHTEELDVKLYNVDARAVLVKCEWNISLNKDKTIPKNVAIPLMLEKVVPSWRESQCAETWEDMKNLLLGSPNGARSSFFVNQEAGQAIKTMYKLLIDSGMYGPIKSEI